MNWIDQGDWLEVVPPKEFNFQECLVFLGRSEEEIVHQIRDEYVYKLIKVDGEMLLFRVGAKGQSLLVEFPLGASSKSVREKVAAYIWDWFDLDQNLTDFYQMASTDKILAKVVKKYEDLRIICIPDLFEALTWAILGQQINLTFAYTLKKRFVECYGESLTYDGHTFWLFPEAENVAALEIDDLRKLQFSTRKAEYILGVAKLLVSGELSKERLLQQHDYEKVHQELTAIRGIGAWTADYVMMKCLHHPSAFPIADVGLHHAIRNQLGMDRKPTIEEIKELSKPWLGWEGYATFYLWRSLYE